MFLGFQYPVEIPGVSNVQFLRTALNAQRRARGEEELSAGEFLRARARAGGRARPRHGHDEARRERRLLGRREEAQRDGPDGDHRSRASPSSTRPIPASTSTRCASSATGINRIMRKPDKAVLLITHYQRLLDIVRARLRPRPRRRPHRPLGRARARPRARARRLWRDGGGGRVSLLTLPSNREEGWRWSDLSALPELAERAADRRCAGRLCPGSTASAKARACCSSTASSTRAAAGSARIAIGPVAVPAPRSSARRASPAARGWTLRARPRPCAARARPDRPCLDRRRRPSRRRDRARRRRPGLDRRDLRRRGLDQPADRHRARQGRAADAQPAAARRRRASSASPTRPSSARAPASSPATLAAGGARHPARRRDRPRRRGRLCRGRRRPARARPAAA